MKLDTNNHLHARDGKYTYKKHQESEVTLQGPGSLDEGFRIKLEATRVYMETHGEKPSYRRETEEEKTLYSWVNKVRTMNKAGTLSEKEREGIESLPIDLLGGDRDSVRVQRLKELENFYEKKGRWPLSRNDTAEAKLSQFANQTAHKIRQPRYADLRALVQTHLKPETARILLREEKARNTVDEHWDSRCDDLQNFIATHGKLPSARSGDAEEESLHVWIKTARRVIRYGDMPEERLQRLRNLPILNGKADGIFHDFRIDTWAGRRQEVSLTMMAYLEKHGAGDRASLVKAHPELGQFISNVASRKRRGQRIEPDMEDLFTQVMGNQWDGIVRRAASSTELLRAFFDKNGRAPAGNSSDLDEQSLYGIYRNRMSRARSGEKISDETASDMASIFGSDWFALKSEKAQAAKTA